MGPRGVAARPPGASLLSTGSILPRHRDALPLLKRHFRTLAQLGAMSPYRRRDSRTQLLESSLSACEDRLRVTVPRTATLSIAFLVVVAALASPGTPASREGLIAFERDYSIYTVKPDGSDLGLLAKRGQRDPGREGDGYLVYPSFTPDGLQVTYLNGIRTTHQSVVVTRVAGGAPRLFRVDGYVLASPLSFSPDSGSAVVARFQERPGEIALYIASTRTGKERQLTGEPTPRRLTKDTSPTGLPTDARSRSPGCRDAQRHSWSYRQRGDQHVASVADGSLTGPRAGRRSHSYAETASTPVVRTAPVFGRSSPQLVRRPLTLRRTGLASRTPPRDPSGWCRRAAERPSRSPTE